MTEEAARIADERAAATVGTVDVLRAVMQVYGDSFDRVLQSYGTDRDEVLERIDRAPAAPHPD